MARPQKLGLEYFPKWNPQRITKKRMNHSDVKVRYRAIRNSSSSFIKRKEVRDIIFKDFNYQCVQCGAKENLEIDHIVSVYRCAIRQFSLEKLNSRRNLTVLCKLCNSSKLP